MKSRHHPIGRLIPNNPVPDVPSTRTGQAQPLIAAEAKPALDPEMRRQMIASAAYYRAEKRGFNGGSEFEDWLDAEAEIDRTLGGLTPEYH